MTTPKTASPELVESQADKEEDHNEGLRRIEAGAGHFRVEDRNLTAPPGACADGATYIISGPSPTGAWASEDGNLAIAVGANASNGWYIIDAEDGMTAWVKDENLRVRFDNTTSPSTWITDTSGGAVSALDDLTDVDVAAPNDGDVLTYDSDSPSGWKALPPAASSLALDDLTDVDASTPTDGYVLTYDTDSPTGWKALPPSGGSLALGDLTDVDVPAPADGYVLTYDTDSPSGWKALPPSGSIEVQDEGVTEEASATILNFTGGGVTATQIGAGEVEISIPGGGTGGVGYEGEGSAPTSSSFTQLNFTNTSVTDYSQGFYLSQTATGNIRMLALTPPSTPWDFYVRLTKNGQLAANDQAGLGLRNSTSGRIIILAHDSGTAVFQQWTNYSTFNASIGVSSAPAFLSNGHMWYRINNDGTTLTAYMSNDGLIWWQVNTTALATFINASGGSVDQVGVIWTPTTLNTPTIQYASFTAPA